MIIHPLCWASMPVLNVDADTTVKLVECPANTRTGLYAYLVEVTRVDSV